MSSPMGHFHGPDDASEIEPFDPESLLSEGHTTTGTTSRMLRRKGQGPSPIIVSGSDAGTSNGQNGSRAKRKSLPTSGHSTTNQRPIDWNHFFWNSISSGSQQQPPLMNLIDVSIPVTRALENRMASFGHLVVVINVRYRIHPVGTIRQRSAGCTLPPGPVYEFILANQRDHRVMLVGDANRFTALKGGRCGLPDHRLILTADHDTADEQQQQQSSSRDPRSVSKVKQENHIPSYVLHYGTLHYDETSVKISGLVIVGVTLWTVFCKHQYISLLSTTNYAIGTYALLAAGVLAIVGGILGCCGVLHEQRAILLLVHHHQKRHWQQLASNADVREALMILRHLLPQAMVDVDEPPQANQQAHLPPYTFILLFVFLLEAIVGGLAYLYETQIETELQHSLNTTFMEHYGVSERQTQAIDSMQQKFSCCGAVRFEDWRHSVWLRSRRKDLIRPTEGRLVPDSCCITVTPKCGVRDGPSNIHYTGCIYEMTDDLKYHLILLGAIGLGLSAIEVFGMILSCCLYVKLKNVLD
ncbi:hypothetical protein AND_007291 [Anopheles darlingi]|uniref:Tetraspanin n=1 Tax=Anopheles darlingi TaxID=43151 RepID=W5JCK9_ANODA|nr:hypothetical protein AND_007291 [Anopheles darlingi]